MKLKDKIKKDLKSLGMAILLIIAIFKIVFYKESTFTVMWAVISFFLTFALPGFIAGYIWHDKLEFLERFVIGIMIGIASVGIISYNISVYLGIHIRTVSIISPLVAAIIFGTLVYFWQPKEPLI